MIDVNKLGEQVTSVLPAYALSFGDLKLLVEMAKVEQLSRIADKLGDIASKLILGGTK